MADLRGHRCRTCGMMEHPKVQARLLQNRCSEGCVLSKGTARLSALRTLSLARAYVFNLYTHRLLTSTFIKKDCVFTSLKYCGGRCVRMIYTRKLRTKANIVDDDGLYPFRSCAHDATSPTLRATGRISTDRSRMMKWH